MTEFKLDHKITEEDVKELNKLLEGSGWTIGKLFLEHFYLEMDTTRAGKYAYYSDDPEEARKLADLKFSLEKKQALILNDLKEP
jgi:hypoxanthine-guanine phosphoribosyltransferase